MIQFISGGYWWQEQAPTLIDGDWFGVEDKTPVNSIHAVDGDVWAYIQSSGAGKRYIAKAHFDGADWYDSDSNIVTVTHWRVIK